MSKILKKDRKPSEMKVILDGEKLAKDILKFANDESRMPKRQRILIANRLVDHSLNSYENIRAANSIYPNTKKKVSNRLSLGQSAETEANKLVTDLRVISSIIHTTDKNGKEEKWYKELVDDAIKYEKEINHWNRGEVNRSYKVYNDSIAAKKKSTDEIKEKIDKLDTPKSNIINYSDISSKDYIKNKIHNNK